MFMTIDDIKNWLNENGYFLNTETNILMVKTGKKLEQAKSIGTKTIVNHSLNNKTINIDGFLLLIDRINSNIGNLNLFIDKNNLPIARLNMGIIRKYHQRNNEIKENQSLKEQLNDVYYIFTHSKKFDKKKYYVIRNEKLIEIHRELVDHSKKMLEVDFISRVNNALRDDETNTFKAEYDLMMQKFDNLGIMEKTEQEA